MAYLIIQDFRRGIDRRRPITMGQPGQLWVCDNAEVTPGGDLARIKKWSPILTLPNGCFGLGFAGGTLWTFGSQGKLQTFPAGIEYQRLEHPKNLPMTAVLDVELFDGEFYVIAEYKNGDVLHFYKGVLVKEIYEGTGRFSGSMAGIATALGEQMKADGWTVLVQPLGSVTRLFLQGRVGQSFTVTASATNRGAKDDQKVTVTVTNEARARADFVAATALLTVTGTSGSLTGLSVEGVALISAPITFNADIHETAANIVTAINAAGTGYKASRIGPTITIRAPNPVNGRLLQVVTSVPGITSGSALFSGYSASDPGAAQNVTVTFEGTYEVDDRYQVVIDGKMYGSTGGPATVGRSAKTHRNKLFMAGGSILNFSGLNNPTKWGLDEAGENIGAGFVNFQTNWGGSEAITAIEEFNGSLAVFSPSCVQLWDMDPDPTKIQLVQTIPYVGALSRAGAAAGNEGAVIFLSHAGIRTINPRASSLYGNIGDIGAPIDALVKADLAATSPEIAANAFAVIEPTTRDFFVAVGVYAYKLVYDATSKVSAWARRTLPGVFDALAVGGASVYAKSGNTIYQLGGPTGEELDDSPIVIETPFLPLEKPATSKAFYGLDVACEGVWTIFMRLDPAHPEAELQVATVTGPTWIDPSILNVGLGTHVSFVLRCETPGPASFSALGIHYKTGEPE